MARLPHTRPMVSTGDRRSDLARASVEVAATVGFEAMTVADIVAHARQGRRSFTRYFSNKEEAFEVGYQEITRELRVEVQAAYDAHRSPIRRTWACLEALAEFLASDPRRAEALLIHGHAAGQGTAAIHCETMRRLTDLILENTAELPQPPGDPRFVAETVAGGIYEIVFTRTLRGQVGTLPSLVPDWAEVVMAPYVAIATAETGQEPAPRP